MRRAALVLAFVLLTYVASSVSPSFVLASLVPAVASAEAGNRTISNSGFGAYEVSLVRMGQGFAAAWYDTRHGHAEIYARVLDRHGAPAGPELRLTNGTRDAYEPDIAVTGDSIVVAWYERDPSSRLYSSIVGGWSVNGAKQWRRELTTRSGRSPVVRVLGNDVFCAWLELAADGAPEVRAQWLGVDGRPQGAPMTIGSAGRTTWNLNVTLDDRGVAWVAFDAYVGTKADELFLARVGHGRHSLTRLTADDGKASKYPDIAIRGDRAAVSWHDVRDGNEEVYLLVAPTASLNGAIDARAVRVTNTPGESIGAYLAWNGNRLGLAWCDNTVGQHEIYLETFDRSGRSIAPAVRVTDTSTQSLIPSIRSAGRRFALAWNEFTPGPGGGHDPRGRSEIVFSLVR
jgi:hypothetical protein